MTREPGDPVVETYITIEQNIEADEMIETGEEMWQVVEEMREAGRLEPNGSMEHVFPAVEITYDVTFDTEEEPGFPTTERVTVPNSEYPDEPTPGERAVVDAAEQSALTHVETRRIQEVEVSEADSN